MVWSRHHSDSVWRLAREQHGVVTRAQLLGLGYSRRAIEHRLARGRLHGVLREVYAVGRPELTREGWWMACVLACGEGAALSHASAAALWGIRPHMAGPVHVSIPTCSPRSRPGIVVHRRRALDVTIHHHIPVTTPAATITDLATTVTEDQLEAAINEADKRDLTDPDELRAFLEEAVPGPGTGTLKKVLDKHAFALTDSALERAFLKIVRHAGLPPPQTQRWVNGYRVDFHWPDLGLVVETDGLRYHRTPAQQARDRVRDQAHAAVGLTTLRFTHAQVKWDREYVEAILREVASRRGAYS